MQAPPLYESSIQHSSLREAVRRNSHTGFGSTSNSGLFGPSSSNDLHSRAGGLCVRGPAAERPHGSSRQLPPHFFCYFPHRRLILFLLLLLPPLPWGAGECAEGQSCGGLSPGALPWTVHPAGRLPLLPTQPPAVAAALAPGPLHRGWEAEGPTPGSCGEVSRKTKVSSSTHHLGWRGNQLLLQGRQKPNQRLSQMSFPNCYLAFWYSLCFTSQVSM